jgi:peroxiredoxin
LPDIQREIWEKHDPTDVIVIGLDPGGLTGQDQNYVEAYAANLGLTFPIMMDFNNSYSQYVGTDQIAPFPLDVVVDRNGVVQLVKRDFDIEVLSAAVDQAVAE